MGKDVCIICMQNKRGYKVIDDPVLSTIRRIKRALRIAKENRLYVCKKCYQEHKKRRGDFEKTVIIYGGLGAIIAMVLLLVNFSLNALVVGILIILFLLFLSLFKYHPAVKEVKKRGRKARG